MDLEDRISGNRVLKCLEIGPQTWEYFTLRVPNERCQQIFEENFYMYNSAQYWCSENSAVWYQKVPSEQAIVDFFQSLCDHWSQDPYDMIIQIWFIIEEKMWWSKLIQLEIVFQVLHDMAAWREKHLKINDFRNYLFPLWFYLYGLIYNYQNETRINSFSYSRFTLT